MNFVVGVAVAFVSIKMENSLPSVKKNLKIFVKNKVIASLL